LVVTWFFSPLAFSRYAFATPKLV